MLRNALSTAILMVVVVGPLTAQSGTTGLGHTPPSSTRAMALGGAYVMGASDPNAVFQHPSLISEASGMTLDIQRWGSASRATSAAAATSWFGGSLGVGIGVQAMQHGYEASSGHTQDPLFQDPITPVSEQAAVLALSGGSAAISDITWGVALRVAEERVGTGRSTDVEVLLGASREIGPMTVGLTFPHVNDGLSEIEFGAGTYGWELGPLDVGLSGRIRGLDGAIVGGGGIEVGYWPVRGRTFVGRLGAQSVPDGSEASPMTMGFAYWGDSLVLEWAFQPFADAPESGTHRLSIGWR